MISEKLANKFKKKLDDRSSEVREEIRRELLKSDDQQYIDLAGKVHDLEEESLADMLVDLNLADIDRHINELRDIEDALSRISTGSYGICIDCSEPIATDRLEVYPTAKRCHDCQVNYERTHIQTGHPTL